MREIEKDLIEKAARGDGAAFREIYDRTSGYVYTLAYRVTGMKHDAEEVTQDVFVRLYRSLGSFKFEASFKTWLYRVTVNSALNHSKKWKGIRMKERGEIREDIEATDASEVSKSLEKEDAGREAKGFLERLNPDQRACLVLREIEGMNYAGIAETLGINLNTVRSRLKRARESLVRMGRRGGE
ncbi:MAG: ECF RNA polymerase sigma factor SigE [Candidatus Omnitrophica bacterium ADurb.Bin277]|nr:MAG: ECF RNA polymerase sigma factor SigE [Candidatus Omnitrophica bacterium ADurb.Bin277]